MVRSIHTRLNANQVAFAVPFSVFPSSYRSDAAVTATEETKSTKVEGEIELEKGREGHSETRFTSSVTSERQGNKRYEEDIRISESRPQQYRREEHVHVSEREREPKQRFEPKQQFEQKQRFEQEQQFEQEPRKRIERVETSQRER